jgi:4-hydroxy-tetrahydrodipicolinate synthase
LQETKGQIMVYAGISGNCLQDSIETGNRFADMGVDAVVIHLPFFFPLSDDAMLRYFESVANSVHCPIILYNNPITVRWSTPLEVIDKLSSHPNIVGFKDSESGLDRVDKAIKLWSRRSDFSYLMGCAAQSAYALLKGCDGIVPSAGNLVPELYRSLYSAALIGNSEEAEKYQQLTDSVSEVYQGKREISHSIPALKTIMSEYGLCKPHVMPPMYDTKPEEQKLLRKKVREVLKPFKKLVE